MSAAPESSCCCSPGLGARDAARARGLPRHPGHDRDPRDVGLGRRRARRPTRRARRRRADHDDYDDDARDDDRRSRRRRRQLRPRQVGRRQLRLRLRQTPGRGGRGRGRGGDDDARDAKRTSSSPRASPGDPHYGKTARGIVRYKRDSVVALLDSQRAGETQEGLPIVGTVNDALCFGPTPPSSASRRRAGASRPSGATFSAAASRRGCTWRTACTSSSPRTRS